MKKMSKLEILVVFLGLSTSILSAWITFKKYKEDINKLENDGVSNE